MYENLWMKRVWVPLWVIQLLFSVIVLVLASFGLGVYNEHEDDISYDSPDEEETFSSAVKIGAGIYIAFSAATILFNVVEIVLFARKRLSPVVAVVLNSILSLVWLIIFILAIVAAVTSGVSVIGFIFYLVITATCKGKLLYSGIVLHRYRKGVRARGAYTPAEPEAGTFATHTAYDPAAGGPPPNPFRDPSRNPSPAPPHNQQLGGVAAEYYVPNGQGYQYEMQQQPVQQQSGGRYA